MAPQVGLLEVVDQFVDLVDVIAVQGAIGGVGAGAMDLEATAAGLGRGALACIEETHVRWRESRLVAIWFCAMRVGDCETSGLVE